MLLLLYSFYYNTYIICYYLCVRKGFNCVYFKNFIERVFWVFLKENENKFFNFNKFEKFWLYMYEMFLC